ncbi:MAG: DUF1330 domain-containing protein [Alphaproteobacteria bacterium]|nr:DUF1330 domain-containing protein [Alphaproteobacteria bacterium]MDX5370077.1 DUF1330 domain-containing protein [Alphaproteobacteria bacterium]MDX5464650.1 DUF1330 domain-containing protein [Alphaproteobacteria bacterium]
MPKGYWIARVDVQDPETYKKYVEGAAPAFKEYGARFIVRGGPMEVREGEGRARNVVIEFDSVETARACYESKTYQDAAKYRQQAAVSDLIIVEGYA